MKTRAILNVLDEFLGERGRSERAVADLLAKLDKKERKLLKRLAEPHDAEEIRILNQKLHVLRAAREKAAGARDSWTGPDVADAATPD